ncbi:hypothetical protein B0H21DRAFT_175395 [Amylocystis lapponica]|nr:hypothetical protein B0H21DRAFT_175395 [Amylocystis lapponica]
MTNIFELPATCPPMLIHVPKCSLPPECHWETLQGEREPEVDYGIRDQNETEQEYEYSTPMFLVNTVLSPLQIDSLTSFSDFKQRKETSRIGLMLSGHSDFEWTPAAPLPKQLTDDTNKHHDNQMPSNMRTWKLMSGDGLTRQRNGIRWTSRHRRHQQCCP